MLWVSVILQAQEPETYFLSFPCLNPTGDTVVFSYAGDLWKTPTAGGAVTRLTQMQGYETHARYSPDGQWIAFTGRCYGNGDIYLIPAAGGEPQRLTFHSSNDAVNSWSWDSKSIYFSSDRTGILSGYKVSFKGGTPFRVLGHYFFQNDHNLFEHPSTGELFFNNTWESSLQAQRKGYKGSFHPSIQSYNLKTGKYLRYTHYNGKNFGATLDRRGNLYFISDQENGEFNLYSLQNRAAVPLTHFPNSVKNAIVNAAGTAVVFEKDYQLHLYDIKRKSSKKLNIRLPEINLSAGTVNSDIKGRISYLDVSPDGMKMAFVSRGEIFVADTGGNFARQLNKGSEERAVEVKWLADNKGLLFSQTDSGYLNWFMMSDDGSHPVRQLTDNRANNRYLRFNADRSQAVYLSGRNELRLMDMTTFQSRMIARDEIWAIWNELAQPAFSPDGQFVSFTAHRNFEEDIMIYHIPTGDCINLTNTDVTETAVYWSPDSKYLYYTGSPLKPAFPRGMQNARVYRLPLQKYNLPFDTIDNKNYEAGELREFINANEITERAEQISPSFGSQYLLGVISHNGQTELFYTSDHDKGIWSIWKTSHRSGVANKTEKITGAEDRRFTATLASGGNTNMALVNGTIYRLLITENRIEPVNLHLAFTKERAAEFRQLFYETWARIDENYYDDLFHGRDWKAIRMKYQPFLSRLHTRDDLRILMNDMFGELNSSHLRLNTGGEDEKVDSTAVTMETGIVFEDSSPYLVRYVLPGSASDKIEIDLRPGDLLTKVNGITVDSSRDRDFYFTGSSFLQSIQLEFKRKGKAFTIRLHPQNSLFTNLYDEWIRSNRKRVASKTGGRIAYICMKNTEQYEYERFLMEMSRQYSGKGGLILDLRYNDGGLAHDDILHFLSQRSYAGWKYRGGRFVKQGITSPADKPIILLVNEQTLSDGEMTAAGFQALGLGKVIGNQTYGWEIFTLRASLIDGSSIRVPSYGCYTIEGRNLENNGVKPDIYVINTFSDNIHGRDPQLDRAISEILKQLKTVNDHP